MYWSLHSCVQFCPYCQDGPCKFSNDPECCESHYIEYQTRCPISIWKPVFSTSWHFPIIDVACYQYKLYYYKDMQGHYLPANRPGIDRRKVMTTGQMDVIIAGLSFMASGESCLVKECGYHSHLFGVHLPGIAILWQWCLLSLSSVTHS